MEITVQELPQIFFIGFSLSHKMLMNVHTLIAYSELFFVLFYLLLRHFSLMHLHSGIVFWSRFMAPAY